VTWHVLIGSGFSIVRYSVKPAPTLPSAKYQVELTGALPGLGVGDGDGVGHGVGDGVGLGVGEGFELGVGDGVGLGVGEGVGLGVGLGVGVGVGLCDTKDERQGVGDTVGLTDAEGLGVGSFGNAKANKSPLLLPA
jgi:hypothetical protein